jgi:hypothetical protein
MVDSLEQFVMYSLAAAWQTLEQVGPPPPLPPSSTLTSTHLLLFLYSCVFILDVLVYVKAPGVGVQDNSWVWNPRRSSNS